MPILIGISKSLKFLQKNNYIETYEHCIFVDLNERNSLLNKHNTEQFVTDEIYQNLIKIIKPLFEKL